MSTDRREIHFAIFKKTRRVHSVLYSSQSHLTTKRSRATWRGRLNAKQHGLLSQKHNLRYKTWDWDWIVVAYRFSFFSSYQSVVISNVCFRFKTSDLQLFFVNQVSDAMPRKLQGARCPLQWWTLLQFLWPQLIPRSNIRIEFHRILANHLSIDFVLFLFINLW